MSNLQFHLNHNLKLNLILYYFKVGKIFDFSTAGKPACKDFSTAGRPARKKIIY
jgi:hypothetical protein